MTKVAVTFKAYEPKKHSVRMSTQERFGGEFALADVYVPRVILDELGLSLAEQNSAELAVTVTYSIADKN